MEDFKEDNNYNDINSCTKKNKVKKKSNIKMKSIENNLSQGNNKKFIFILKKSLDLSKGLNYNNRENRDEIENHSGNDNYLNCINKMINLFEKEINKRLGFVKFYELYKFIIEFKGKIENKIQSEFILNEELINSIDNLLNYYKIIDNKLKESPKKSYSIENLDDIKTNENYLANSNEKIKSKKNESNLKIIKKDKTEKNNEKQDKDRDKNKEKEKDKNQPKLNLFFKKSNINEAIQVTNMKDIQENIQNFNEIISENENNILNEILIPNINNIIYNNRNTNNYIKELKDYFISKKEVIPFIKIQKINKENNLRRYIFIEGSLLNEYRNIFNKKSNIINGRCPCKQDNIIIDYDLDSEEEFQELNGEDVESKINNEEQEEEESIDGEDEDKWIVSDGHISEEEEDNNKIKKEFKIENDNLINSIIDLRNNYQKPIVINFCQDLNKKRINIDKNEFSMTNEIISDFKISQLKSILEIKLFNKKDYKLQLEIDIEKEKYESLSFPLRNNRKDKEIQNTDFDEYLNEIIKIVHFSFENNKDILKEEVYKQFKPQKKKELDLFFNNNVIKTKCLKTNQRMFVIKKNILEKSNLSQNDLNNLYDKKKTIFIIKEEEELKILRNKIKSNDDELTYGFENNNINNDIVVKAENEEIMNKIKIKEKKINLLKGIINEKNKKTKKEKIIFLNKENEDNKCLKIKRNRKHIKKIIGENNSKDIIDNNINMNNNNIVVLLNEMNQNIERENKIKINNIKVRRKNIENDKQNNNENKKV